MGDARVSDPFRHHPNLKGKIAAPDTSFWRDFSLAKLRAIAEEKNLPVDWWHSDEHRENLRRTTLQDRMDDDLWIFAFGSLMWDPGVYFEEVRRGRVDGFHRAFIVRDIYGARGTPEKPALMAALDEGGACDGLVFRLGQDTLDHETAILWQREFVSPGYIGTFVSVETHAGPVEAMACVADPTVDIIDRDIDRATQVRYLATATGFMGSSADYLRGVAEKLRDLGIDDPDVEALLSEVETYRDTLS